MSHQWQYDICIAAIPYVPYHLPLSAPAALKGHLLSRGFRACTREFNLETRVLIADDDVMETLASYWIDADAVLDASTQARYHAVLDQLAQEITAVSCKWIGISVFTFHSQRFCRDWLQYVSRYRRVGQRILLGGLGLDDAFLYTVRDQIDCYIMGDGELALEHLLRGEMEYPGINSAGEQIRDLDVLVAPDYSDYHRLREYDNFYDGPAIKITGSRGCVRSCSFCDVAKYWPKFSYRSGRLIADDIMTLHKKTGVRHFIFSDSLVNGNLKQLMEMMRVLADYNATLDQPISWGGQWISRKQQGLPRDYYDLIKRSGGRELTIGVETGSDRVREHMRKGFTNQDLDAEMEQFSRHGITCGFYIMVGYPTETFSDFCDTLDMFQRYTRYVADGTINGVMLGNGFFPLKDTPILEENNRLFVIEDLSRRRWRNDDAELDYAEVVRRRIIAQRVVDNLGYPANYVFHELKTSLANIAKDHPNARSPEEIQRRLDQMEQVVAEYQLPREPAEMSLELTLKGSRVEDWPRINVYVNDRKVHSDLVVTDNIVVTVPVRDLRRRNMLRIEMTNKGATDTRVENDAIVADKNVVIQSIVFDQVRVRHDELWSRSRIRTAQGQRRTGCDLFENGSVYIYFENPSTQYWQRQRAWYAHKNHDLIVRQIHKLIEFYQSV
jgi:radical SAM superfamily enzyme YgiQ (UPF0313 family)